LRTRQIVQDAPASVSRPAETRSTGSRAKPSSARGRIEGPARTARVSGTPATGMEKFVFVSAGAESAPVVWSPSARMV